MDSNQFPVLEFEMDKQSLRIRLADDASSLVARLPKEMMDGIVAKWQAFQNGTATEPLAYSRHYTGQWDK